MQAVIMAGGKGERLKQLTKTMPKPLLEVGNKPLLDRLIEHAKEHGIGSVIVCTGHLAEKIRQHIDGRKYGIKVDASAESRPFGTAGALNLIRDRLEDEFFVLYGDVYTEVNLRKMLAFHKQKNADATLLLHSSSHPQDSTIVSIDPAGRITHFAEKPGENWKKYGNLTSAALYIMKRGVLEFIEAGKEADFAKDVFPEMLEKGKKIFGYVSEDYTKDIGTPERYEEVKEHVANPEKTGKKAIAAFLDRDGVINEEFDFITKPEHIIMIKGSSEGIKLLNSKGILAIITTNQPVVARNLVTEEGLKEIHSTLIRQLGKKGARIDAIYYCPHHPEKNHPEANDPKYRRECDCRKPKTGMIEEAAKNFNIDVKNSYVVGDRTVDIQMGKNAGCTTILLRTGKAGSDGKHQVAADYICDNLLDACRLIAKISGVGK